MIRSGARVPGWVYGDTMVVEPTNMVTFWQFQWENDDSMGTYRGFFNGISWGIMGYNGGQIPGFCYHNWIYTNDQ